MDLGQHADGGGPGSWAWGSPVGYGARHGASPLSEAHTRSKIECPSLLQHLQWWPNIEESMVRPPSHYVSLGRGLAL